MYNAGEDSKNQKKKKWDPQKRLKKFFWGVE